MIKLFSVKEKQKQDAAAAAAGKPKQSAGELRVQKGGLMRRAFPLFPGARVRARAPPLMRGDA